MEMKMTVKFNEQELVEIIKEKLQKEGFEVESGKIVLRTQSTGFGPSERDETVFEGFEVKVKQKKQTYGTTYFDR